jgi:hypothetical protein
MQKFFFVAAIFFPATLLLAQTNVHPLNVKPGLWQVTMTTIIEGMGSPQTRSYKSCLKKEDLNKYPFTDPDKNCTYKVVTSTGSTMEAHGSCAPGSEGAKVDFNLRLNALDTETVKGTGQMNMNFNGRAVNGTYSASAKWVAAACPASMN